jgi:hypothetical protein
MVRRQGDGFNGGNGLIVRLTEGKFSGSFILIMGTILVGAMILFTGIQYLFSGSGVPISPLLVVIAVGITVMIVGILLAKHYL